MAAEPLTTVPSVDLERYAGKWFEIARFPNSFQKDCAGNVTAEYSRNPDGTIRVVNRCREASGDEKTAEGVARVAPEAKASNSVLEVRFAPAFLSFIPAVWGDYRILSLDADYSRVLVGSNDRKYLWILSRTPQLDPAIYQKLLDQAAKQGFDVGRMVRTPQNLAG